MRARGLRVRAAATADRRRQLSSTPAGRRRGHDTVLRVPNARVLDELIRSTQPGGGCGPRSFCLVDGRRVRMRGPTTVYQRLGGRGQNWSELTVIPAAEVTVSTRSVEGAPRLGRSAYYGASESAALTSTSTVAPGSLTATDRQRGSDAGQRHRAVRTRSDAVAPSAPAGDRRTVRDARLHCANIRLDLAGTRRTSRRLLRTRPPTWPGRERRQPCVGSRSCP